MDDRLVTLFESFEAIFSWSTPVGLVGDVAINVAGDENQRAAVAAAVAELEAHLRPLGKTTATAVCGWCMATVELRTHPAPGGGGILAMETHVDGQNAYGICGGRANSFMDARITDHNELSEALGVERGAEEWHKLIARVKALKEGLDG